MNILDLEEFEILKKYKGELNFKSERNIQMIYGSAVEDVNFKNLLVV